MSLCGTVVVVKKRVKRSLSRHDHSDCDSDDSDDSSSPISYTYTNCDSVAMLSDSPQQPFSQLLDRDDDDSSAPPPPFQWLNWRLDPIRTFSDWMIDVVVVNKHRNPSVDKASHEVSRRYHVHKCVLVVESLLFQDLFYKHQHPQDPLLAFTATKIILPNEREANVFPTFLDYMYSPGAIWINQQNVNTLLLLSNYFGMQRLKWLTKQFLKHNQGTIFPEAGDSKSESNIPTNSDNTPCNYTHPPAIKYIRSSDVPSSFYDTLNHLQQIEAKDVRNRHPVSNTPSLTSIVRSPNYTDAELRKIISKKQHQQQSSSCTIDTQPIK